MSNDRVSDGDEQPENADGPPSSVLRPRLAAAPVEACPTLEELGLVHAKDAAFAWQTQRSRVRWMGVMWPMVDPRSGDWIPSIYGLLGAAGEVVLTSIEAAAEIELAARALDGGGSRTMHAALSRSVRFFAEGQVNNLAVFGHNAANLTLRTLMLFEVFEPSEIQGITPEVFAARSVAKGSWVSLSPKLPGELDRAIRRSAGDGVGLPPEATRLVSLVRELVEGPWRDLYNHRNDLYHGWRGEADGVTGVNFGAPSVADRFAAGEVISLGTDPEPYVEGLPGTKRTREVAARALDQVARWMPRYLDAWSDTMDAAHPQQD